MASSRSTGNKRSQKRNRLDPLSDQKKRFIDEEGDLLDLPDLPEQEASTQQSGVEKARTCEKCGSTEVRIYTNRDGVRAACIKCKHDVGVSMMSMRPSLPMTMPRGISKQTIVQPDWSLAEMDLDAEDFSKDVTKKGK